MKKQSNIGKLIVYDLNELQNYCISEYRERQKSIVGVVVAVQEALDSRKTKKHSRGPCGFRKKDYFYNWGEVITVLEALDSKTKYFKALTSENPFKLWTSAVIASKRTNSKLFQNSRTTTYIKGIEFSLALLN